MIQIMYFSSFFCIFFLYVVGEWVGLSVGSGVDKYVGAAVGVISWMS